MSGKQMKRLRKAALGLAASLDSEGRQIVERSLYAKEHKRSAELTNAASFLSDSTAPAQTILKTFAITAINRPDSLRGITRTIKKGMKSGKIPKLPARNSELLSAHEDDGSQ